MYYYVTYKTFDVSLNYPSSEYSPWLCKFMNNCRMNKGTGYKNFFVPKSNFIKFLSHNYIL